MVNVMRLLARCADERSGSDVTPGPLLRARCAIFNGAAMADAEYLLMLGYIYEGYVKLNYHTGHAVQQKSIRTDLLARTLRSLACSCAFVEYLCVP